MQGPGRTGRQASPLAASSGPRNAVAVSSGTTRGGAAGARACWGSCGEQRQAIDSEQLHHALQAGAHVAGGWRRRNSRGCVGGASSDLYRCRRASHAIVGSQKSKGEAVAAARAERRRPPPRHSPGAPRPPPPRSPAADLCHRPPGPRQRTGRPLAGAQTCPGVSKLRLRDRGGQAGMQGAAAQCRACRLGRRRPGPSGGVPRERGALRGVKRALRPSCRARQSAVDRWDSSVRAMAAISPFRFERPAAHAAPPAPRRPRCARPDTLPVCEPLHAARHWHTGKTQGWRWKRWIANH